MAQTFAIFPTHPFPAGSWYKSNSGQLEGQWAPRYTGMFPLSPMAAIRFNYGEQKFVLSPQPDSLKYEEKSRGVELGVQFRPVFEEWVLFMQVAAGIGAYTHQRRNIYDDGTFTFIFDDVLGYWVSLGLWYPLFDQVRIFGEFSWRTYKPKVDGTTISNGIEFYDISVGIGYSFDSFDYFHRE